MKSKLNVPTQQLEQIQLMKIKLESQKFKKQKFNDNEIEMFQIFCKMLGYFFSINPQKQTIKIFNEKTSRHGSIQKFNNQYWYGYFKQLAGSSTFIRKYTITDNIALFSQIAKIQCNSVTTVEDKNTIVHTYGNQIKSLGSKYLNLFCGIVELEYTNI